MGIAAAVLFLIVVMPPLVMSDKIFSEFFYRFFGYLDLSYLIENVDIENIVGITFIFFIGAVGIYEFFAAVFRMNLRRKEELKKGNVNPVTGITFTAILAVIYVFYSMIQEDVCYLIYGLSDDAAPEIVNLNGEELTKLGVIRDVDNYFYGISEKYRDMGLRIWNFSGNSAMDAAERWREKRE